MRATAWGTEPLRREEEGACVVFSGERLGSAYFVSAGREEFTAEETLGSLYERSSYTQAGA